jgi:hypothetical protein
MVRRLAGVPISISRRDSSRSDRFVQSTPSRIGSPAVNSASNCRKLSSSEGRVAVSGGRPPLFFGPVRQPDPRLHPSPSCLAGSFSDRTTRAGRCNRRRHARASPPRLRRTAADPSPTANHRTVSSSLRRLQSRLPCPHPREPRSNSTRRNLPDLRQIGKLCLTMSLPTSNSRLTVDIGTSKSMD